MPLTCYVGRVTPSYCGRNVRKHSSNLISNTSQTRTIDTHEKLRSKPSSSAVGHSFIAVVGDMIMDVVFESERMPALDASSLADKPGGKGSNTAVAIYRAQHKKPINGQAEGQS